MNWLSMLNKSAVLAASAVLKPLKAINVTRIASNRFMWNLPAPC